MSVFIILKLAGSSTGPFNLYSNVDSYTSAFEIGVPKASLIAGYISTLVPAETNIIKVLSTGVCDTSVLLNLTSPSITTTTTTTTGTGTTTTTTTNNSPTTTTTTTPFIEPGPTVENQTFFTLN